MEPESTSILPFVKALHLIAMVTYFAGTFHMVRVFVAHREALGKAEPDRGILHKQFSLLERRALYYLISPSLLLLIVLGIWMLAQQPALLKQPFMHAKLGVVALLIGYHALMHRVYAQLKRAEVRWSALQLQLFAQGPTVLLFTLVVLVIMRDRLGWVWGSMGLLVVGGVIAYAVARTRRKALHENDA
ncbi:MAG: CopD family protein [Flavobacteriales bacterium]|nr:CopD family protein [Flavobacteriales bacterium]